MKKFVVSIVLGAGLFVGVTPAAAGEGGRFFVGEWKPSKTSPSVVRAGVQVKGGVIDRWFVTTREQCTIGDAKPAIAEHNSYTMLEKDLEIDGRHFRYSYANRWGTHTEIRSVFRGKIEGDTVKALYRSRIRNHSPHHEREKCRTGPLHFELERGSSHAFFDGFDPFRK